MKFLSKSSFRIAAAFSLSLLFCANSEACSVCVTGKEEARGAYYATTAILSFLPLIMIGALVRYLIKRSR